MRALGAAALCGVIAGFTGSMLLAPILYRRAYVRTCRNVSARTAEQLVTDWRRDHPVPISGTGNRERKEP